MESIRTVIIIPTYNNAQTIERVISGAKEHVRDILVINDGSTDKTGEILRSISNIELLEFSVNRGKGAALQAAFKRALQMGFTHAITIDADGQHLTEDIALFLQKIKQEPDVLWLGDRILPVEGGRKQPLRSRFGRRFGAFWYKFYTGVYVRDTQSGFRAYPLVRTNALECKGERYEYEIELLITAAWNHIPVKCFPVHLLYLPEAQRVSHFRPIRDFMRISKVNSRAAITKLFFPSNMIDVRGFSLREKIKQLIAQEIRANATPVKAALSLATGVFMAVTPFHGFQVVSLLALTFLLRLNRPLAMLGVSVSSAPLIPLWIAGGLGVGKVVLPAPVAASIVKLCQDIFPPRIISYISNSPVQGFMQGFFQWFIGSLVLAVICGVTTFGIALPFFNLLKRGKKSK